MNTEIKNIGIAALLYLLMLAGAIYFDQIVSASIRHETMLASNIGKIYELDEILTMSAKMFASSRNFAYKERYDRHVDRLDKVIQETFLLVDNSDAKKALKETEDANQTLVAMEVRSFWIASQNGWDNALQLLESDEYVRNKKLYKHGLENAFRQLESSASKSTITVRNLLRGAEGGFVILTVIIGYLWRKSQINKSIIASAVNKRLEYEVNERTREITHVKELAERASNAKSEFLANMSHEFRTPLHSILSFSALGLKKAGTDMPDNVIRYLNRIQESGRKLIKMVDALLDLSKLEAGKMELDFDRSDLGQVIENCMSEQEILAQKQGIALEYKRDCEDTLCEHDSFRMAQVVTNLLSNAIKFSGAGNTVIISLKEDRLMTPVHDPNQPSEEALRLTIKDQGVGIPTDELESVFDKFIQSSKTTTGAGGTGLGLAISKEIVLRHRGRIWAESVSGEGSTFTVLVPKYQS